MARGLLGASLLIAASTGLAGEQVVFRAGIDLVTFGVTVTDRRGGLVTDLGRDDFEIVEDGRRQVIEYFSPGGGEEALSRLHTGLMLDTSASMERDLTMARSAAIKFLNLLPQSEDITLVDFDTEVRVARFGAADFPRFVERLRTRKPDGWTALYDALGVYLEGTAFQSGEKVVVAYTDGGDTRSVMSFSDALTALKASDVTVYVVGFLERQGSREKLEQRMRLTQLAEATGGLAFFPTSRQDIDQAYRQIQADVDGRYLLGYVSSNQANDGTWRTLDVRLNRTDLKSARIRTRKGYFALLRQESIAARPE